MNRSKINAPFYQGGPRRKGYGPLNESGEETRYVASGSAIFYDVVYWLSFAASVTALVLGAIAVARLNGGFTTNGRVIANDIIECPQGKNPNDPLELTLVTKNVYFGMEFGSTLGASLGYTPELPSYFVFLDLAFDLGIATEENLQRSFENLWQFMTNPDLFPVIPRLNQIADELAMQNADIIGLQEVLLATNNPTSRPDGAPFLFGDYFIENIFAGEEDSVEEWRTYDFAKMIVRRLNETHGQEFDIVSTVLQEQNESPRTLGAINEATARFQWGINNVILVRTSLGAKVVREVSEKFLYSRQTASVDIRQGDQWNNTETVRVHVSGFDRGYNSVDLDICGKTVRVINTHLPSGNSIPDIDVKDTNRKNQAGSAAQNACALQLIHEEIKTSPHPVVLLGDLNQESCREATFQLIFPCSAMHTLIGSVFPNGTLSSVGGVMRDTCVEVHGDDCYDNTKFRTSSLTAPGPPLPKWDDMRNVEGYFRNRLDHILVRSGDPITTTYFNVTLPTPFTPTPSKPFAFPSDHQGIVAKLKIN